MSGGSGDDLDRETEDLLSMLDSDEPGPPAKRGLTELLDDLDDSKPPPQAWPLETESDAAPAAVIQSRPDTDSSRYPRVESDQTEAPTRYDKPLDPNLTPPSNPPFEPGFSPPPRPRPRPPPPELAAGGDDPEEAAAAADAALAAADPLAALRVETRERPRTLLWVAIISFALAALGAVVYTQSDAFHPEREATRAMVAEDEKERALAEHQRRQPEQGQLVIDASEPEAAVWLKLGRTPLRSLAVRSGQVHYVRYELEGHQSADRVIARAQWTGGDGEQEARQDVQLSRGTRALPSFPPEPAVRPAPGPPGKGPMVLSSTPAGAEVWLLIGITPDVKLTGVRAGRRYELKVLKQGYRPAFASIKESDWAMGEREVRARVKLEPVVARRRR